LNYAERKKAEFELENLNFHRNHLFLKNKSSKDAKFLETLENRFDWPRIEPWIS